MSMRHRENSENLHVCRRRRLVVPSIDFSSILTATDADGDTVTGAAQGAFTITVQDDFRCDMPARRR